MTAFTLLRWTARLAGLLVVAVFLAFLVGEGPPPLLQMTWKQNTLLGALFVMAAGFLVAWQFPRTGGWMSVGGWLCFGMMERRFLEQPYLWVPLAIAGLNLLTGWWASKGSRPVHAGRWGTISFLVLAVVLALLANEAFGMPPAFAEEPVSREGLAGQWEAVLTVGGGVAVRPEIRAVWRIHPDGTVTGTLGSSALLEARLKPNRTRLGRWLRLRTDWIVIGRLSPRFEVPGYSAGNRFTAPMDFREGRLSGSLFLRNPGPFRPIGLELRRVGQ
jgi:hypothetical protein